MGKKRKIISHPQFWKKHANHPAVKARQVEESVKESVKEAAAPQPKSKPKKVEVEYASKPVAKKVATKPTPKPVAKKAAVKPTPKPAVKKEVVIKLLVMTEHFILCLQAQLLDITKN